MCRRGFGEEITIFVASIIVILLNTIFFALGLALVILGILLLQGGDALSPWFTSALGGIDSLSHNTNITSASHVNTAETVASILSIFSSASWAVIVMGFFFILLALAGIFGSCCWLKSMLKAYIVLISITFLLHVVMLACLYGGAFGQKLRESMQLQLMKYEGLNSKSSSSLMWNYFMVKYECCGLDSYKDFKVSSEWHRIRVVNDVERFQKTPLACCKLDGEFPKVTPRDPNCDFQPTDKVNNWKVGCWGAVHEKLFKPSEGAVIGVNCAVMFIELMICGISAFLLWEKIQEKEETLIVRSPHPSSHGRSDYSQPSRISHRDHSASSHITSTTPVGSHTVLKIKKDNKEITITPVSNRHSKHSAHSSSSTHSKHSYLSSSRHSQKPIELLPTAEVDSNTALKIKKKKNEVTITPVSAHSHEHGSKHNQKASSHHDTKHDGHNKSLFGRLIHSHHNHDQNDTQSIPTTSIENAGSALKITKKKNEVTISPVSSHHK